MNPPLKLINRGSLKKNINSTSPTLSEFYSQLIIFIVQVWKCCGVTISYLQANATLVGSYLKHCCLFFNSALEALHGDIWLSQESRFYCIWFIVNACILTNILRTEANVNEFPKTGFYSTFITVHRKQQLKVVKTEKQLVLTMCMNPVFLIYVYCLKVRLPFVSIHVIGLNGTIRS